MKRTPAHARRIAVIGAGGHGRVVADIAAALGYAEIVFIDRRWPEQTSNHIWPVISQDVAQALAPETDTVVAIGQCRTRLALLRDLQARRASIATLIHPAAVVSPHAIIGLGSVVMPEAVINVGARLGAGCIANTACSIDHDCQIADGVHVSPGAHLAGGVTVGEASWVGIGSAVIEGMTLGRDVMVAAGAVVTTALADGVTVYGVPARPMAEKGQ